MILKLVKSLEMMQEKRRLIIIMTTTELLFLVKLNTRGPSVTKIVKENCHLLQNNKILKGLFPEYSILVANKRKSNLKDLLLKRDLYNIKKNLFDNAKHGYKSCKKKFDSCNNFLGEKTAIKYFATGRIFNPLSANPTKWPNALKQFVGKLPMNCVSVFGHFVKLALKRLKSEEIVHVKRKM